MMSNYRDIIIAPIITEKTADEMQNNNTYTFEVAKSANKTQIKKAIENIFNVKVEKVNTVNTPTKKKRVGKYTGTTKSIKKAIVKLSEGSIELN
jgi:large subunit ribosomal protein L23